MLNRLVLVICTILLSSTSDSQGKNNVYTLTDTGYRLSKIVKGVIG
jgi:hypothetical protein